MEGNGRAPRTDRKFSKQNADLGSEVEVWEFVWVARRVIGGGNRVGANLLLRARKTNNHSRLVSTHDQLDRAKKDLVNAVESKHEVEAGAALGIVCWWVDGAQGRPDLVRRFASSLR